MSLLAAIRTLLELGMDPQAPEPTGLEPTVGLAVMVHLEPGMELPLAPGLGMIPPPTLETKED
jgi:hypothetical protein